MEDIIFFHVFHLKKHHNRKNRGFSVTTRTPERRKKECVRHVLRRHLDGEEVRELGGVKVGVDGVLRRLERGLVSDPGEHEKGAESTILSKENIRVEAIAHRGVVRRRFVSRCDENDVTKRRFETVRRFSSPCAGFSG